VAKKKALKKLPSKLKENIRLKVANIRLKVTVQTTLLQATARSIPLSKSGIHHPMIRQTKEKAVFTDSLFLFGSNSIQLLFSFTIQPSAES